MKQLAFLAAALAFASSAVAAGVDSRAYSCAGLQTLIAANHFVFLNNPSFGDFVVADASSCSGGEVIQLRTVPTADQPECLVNYCKSRGGGGGN